jgi:hypothetical protein
VRIIAFPAPPKEIEKSKQLKGNMQEKTKRDKKEDEAKIRDIQPEKDTKGGGGGGGTHGTIPVGPLGPGDHQTTGPLGNQ